MSKKWLLGLSLGLFLSFIYFSYLVHRGVFNQFDFDTTVKLQNHIKRYWDLPFSILTLLGSAEVTGVIWLFLVILALLKRFWLTAVSLSLFVAGLATELYGKVFVYHPAPPFMFYRGVLNFEFPSSYIQTSYSYPSGHAFRTTFLVTFIILWLYLQFGRKLILSLGLLVFLFGVYISRVYLGEHWSTDVIGGALIGSSLGILSSLTLPKLAKN